MVVTIEKLPAVFMYMYDSSEKEKWPDSVLLRVSITHTSTKYVCMCSCSCSCQCSNLALSVFRRTGHHFEVKQKAPIYKHVYTQVWSFGLLRSYGDADLCTCRGER